MESTKELCAEGARAFRNDSGHAALIVAINSVLVYLWQTNKKEGSEKHYTLYMEQSYRRVARRFFDITSEQLEEWDGYQGRDWLAWQIAVCRKRGYKELQRAHKTKTRPNLNGMQPLFPECENGTIYAYICERASLMFRVVKLGYTGDEINSYLRQYKEDRNPQLLATMPGDKALEAQFHRTWSTACASGREFYYLRSNIRDWIARTYTDFEPDWKEIWEDSVNWTKS